MDSDLSTGSVTHFTRKYDNLVGILKNGFKPSCCSESPIYQKEHKTMKTIFEYMGFDVPIIENVVIPMVCFCDIPPKLSRRHKEQYGCYSISLSKKWVIKNGISPVLYIRMDTRIHSILYGLLHTFEILKSALPEKNVDESLNIKYSNLQRHMNEFWTYVKPYCSDDSSVKFYDEREWRFVPINYVDKVALLTFEISDITQIIVTSRHEKDTLIKHFKSECENVDSKIIKIVK